MFLAKKKEEGHHPLINLKYLNIYRHFKRDGIHLTKDLLQRNEFLIKKRFKIDVCFLIHPNKQSRRYMRLRLEKNLCRFLLFSIWFFQRNSRGRERPFLIPLYHFYTFHEHLHSSRMIAAVS